MSVHVLGLSHKTAPVEVRERFAIAESETAGAVTELISRPGIDEACILSTCNRVEFLVRSAESPENQILAFLDERRPLTAAEAQPYLYRYSDREAIQHVFRVASSLDSLVVGEPQILGQIKDAYQAAKLAGGIRGPLDQLLSASFRVARRVRNETGIGQMAVSVSFVAVELARKIFGDLDGLSVLIIGAGEMAEASLRSLHAAGAREIAVTNRTFERAEALAREFTGEAVPFDRLLEALTRVDIVISSTGSDHYVLERATAEKIIAARRNRPIFFVDIAVPRDIDPQINQIDNIFVYDIDDLRQVADANLKHRRKEAELAEAIILEETHKMLDRIKSAQVAPTIVSLQQRLELLRQAEIDRFRSKLGDLTPEQQQAIEGLTRGLMNKIAHAPITEMKRLAREPDGLRFVEFVKRVFNLHSR